MDRTIEIQLRDQPPWVVASYSGPIDAGSEDHLAALHKLEARKFTLNLRQVSVINSNGVRCWILFLQQFVKGRVVRLEECSPAVVEQMTMIPTFYLGCEVLSVIGVYECFDCDTAENAVISMRQPVQVGKAPSCPNCKKAMELDECTDDFLQFFNPLSAVG